MNRKAKLLIFTALLSVSLHPLGAAEITSTNAPSAPKQSLYQLPDTVKEEHLIPSAVIITCGSSRGTGIALGEKYILTAAHVMVPYVLLKDEIRVFAVTKVDHTYGASAYPWGETSQGVKLYQPDCSTNTDFRELIIKQVHFPKGTSVKKSNEMPKVHDFSSIMREYGETMGYGLASSEKLQDFGVLTEIALKGTVDEVQVKISGPDVALLECSSPHGLPSLEISDPIQEDRSLIHIIGLAGVRYSHTSPYDVVGGVTCTVNREPSILFSPRIISQRFRCFQVYPGEGKMWFNRPFLKIIRNQYFLNDEVYPNAPKGFGLIAQGDSCSGAVVIKDGKPYLVGVASEGGIDGFFKAIHDLLAEINFDSHKITSMEQSILFNLYNDALKTREDHKKWYVRQTLADVTYLKPWIESFTKGL